MNLTDKIANVVIEGLASDDVATKEVVVPRITSVQNFRSLRTRVKNKIAELKLEDFPQDSFILSMQDNENIALTTLSITTFRSAL